MDQLLRLVATAPAVAMVEGEAGVGKTRLVTELLARPELDGRRRLIGRCHPLRDPFPLGPVVDALRGLAAAPPPHPLPAVTGALRIVLPELGSHLAPAPPALGDPRAERHVLFRAVVELLAHLGPTVCFLEDLHWADDTTGELLRYLATQMPHDLVMIGTYRREDLRPSSRIGQIPDRLGPAVAAGTVAVTPLPEDGVGKLVSAILGAADVPDATAVDLHRRTGGIPFAVEEVLRLLDDRAGALLRRTPRVGRTLDAVEVPAAVRDSVTGRLASISRSARRIAEAAAVLGVPAREEELAAVAGIGDVRGTAALREALEASVLFEVADDRYGFRHALATQAVYDSIPRPERRRLHLRVVETLHVTGPGAAGILARHYREAGRLEEFARHAEAAADEAHALHDDEAAASLLHDVLVVPDLTTGDRARLAVKLAMAALSSATPPDNAVALLRTILDRDALPPDVRGEVRALFGGLLVAAGDASAGYREQERAVRELTWRPELAVRVMLNLASPWVLEGHESEHRRWLSEAVRAAGDDAEPAVLLAVSIAQALVPLYLGDGTGWQAAEHLPATAETPAQMRQVLWGRANLVGACYHLGHYPRARGFLDDAVRIAATTGWGQMLHIPEAARILLDWAEGRWDGLAERAHRHSEEMADFPGWSVDSMLVEGSLALAHGDADEATRCFGACFMTALTAGIIPGAAIAAGGLTRARLIAGDAGAACNEAARGLEVIRRKGIWAWAAELAPPAVDAMLAADRADDASTLVSDFDLGLRGRDAPLAAAALTLCGATVAEARGDTGAAARDYDRAQSAYAALPRPYDAALVAVRLGACRLARGDAQGAEVLLQRLPDLEALGATADAGRVRRLLRQHSVSIPRPSGSGRRGYGSRLSPREEEVAELARRGLTNAEIARQLFLSPRTVEHHLTTAMHKLGVSSRRELRARHGLGSNDPG